MARLGSKKSRTGCIQCKARRVKCDENRPCGACTRYRVGCSLLGHAASTRSDTTSQPSRAIRTASVSTEGTGSRSAHVNAQSTSPESWSPYVPHHMSPPNALADGTTGQWMEDLELMHHYTAHAHLTMPGSEHTKQIWGYAVPQEAFKFPFLMHCMLAFSANHLAHINPSRMAHYHLLASTHQSAALTRLNTALGELGPVNCHAIFVGASMTVVNTFADARRYDLDVLIETFQLLRGMEYVLQKVTPMIEKGPFAAIVRPTLDPPKPSPLLSSFLVELQSSCSPSSNPTSAENLRLRATECLRQALQLGLDSSPHPALRAAMLWPIKVEAEFVELLRTRRDPEVRALFKQYCRLLEFASTEFWFFAGWRGITQQL
ncbi:hypothetical protein T440DRAFT_111735 [Plenodomus tracheiphilus IPT5]|uniref:Zn(2)-C6 fungal-type domain-containing protein n=1 Tax=Plenodomus tracheiphilus IPT5 TaxID=1408161 RepID=A0A6A7B7N3_9PLEO|nr:hypothetical protein T440DRAFT_111735 [Plenodomus tracheiphilus IPT5]